VNGSRVRIGLLGCGTVGVALINLLEQQADAITARTGLKFEITRVAVRDLSLPRSVGLPAGRFTSDAAVVVNDPAIDVVVELMGGVDPARQLVIDALTASKPVVTANKELLANHGSEIFAAADASGVDILFEAAVAGGIPLVRPLRESLLGEPIEQVMGIVNGTTNYILTQMTESAMTYSDALAEAQTLGYAEADPSADVDGFDAGAKIAILASIAFGARVVASDVYHEGISGVTADDIEFATRNGYVLKLVGIAERVSTTGPLELALRVHPVLMPVGHPLASVNGSFNAVFVRGAAVGELMFYGRGAGGTPTASAVLGDLIDAALNVRGGSSASIGVLSDAIIRPLEELESEYYLHLHVVDQPGVLSAVAGVFGAHGVSISTMSQGSPGEDADLVFITHRALERDMQATLADLRALDAVRKVGSVIRVLAASPVMG